MFRTALSRCSNLAVTNSRRLPSLRHMSSGIDFKKLIANNKVVVFMKGVPERPRCGYSHTVVTILKEHGVEFDAHDVLENNDMREGIKEYNNWPTIPQIFIDNEFIGGQDILLKMHKSGELIERLEKAGIKSLLADKKSEAKTE